MILDKKVKSQWVGEEEHDFIIGTAMNHHVATHPTRGHRHFKIMFLFLDSLIFLTFVQNNCCGTNLKAISKFFILRFIHFFVMDNKVKKDLLIVHSKSKVSTLIWS